MRISDWSSDVCSSDLWVKTKRPCDMTASRSGLGPASGGDALESVTGKDRSNNDVKQPLTRLVVNFYRTVVAEPTEIGPEMSSRRPGRPLQRRSADRTHRE